MIKILVGLCALLGVATSQMPMFGFCPDMPSKQNFSTELFTGSWYEQEHLPILGNRGKCNVKILTNLRTLFNVIKKKIDIITNEVSIEFGYAYFHQGPSVANMLWYILPPSMNLPHEVKIIATDYTNYAIFYYCVPIGILHTRHAQILTRARYPSAAVMNAAYFEFNKVGLDQQSLIKIDHTNCPDSH